MTQTGVTDNVETAIAAVYRGPLEQFISRRDALIKQLRATKEREAADRVKALRKPSRMAWVLDNIAHDDPDAIEQLATAIGEAQTADDVRTAFERVKEAVRNVAAVGARSAVRANQPIQPNEIVAAIHAVIGHAVAFADFRTGRLVDVPEGGGLDMLTAVSVREPSHKTKQQPPAPAAVKVVKTVKPDARAAAAAHELELAKKAARRSASRGSHAY